MYPAISAHSHPTIHSLAEEVVPIARPAGLAGLRRLLPLATLRTIPSKTIDREGYVRECRRAIAEFLMMGVPK